MTMKPQHPVQTVRALHWHQLQLPVGLQAAAIKVSVDGLELAQPTFDPNGLVLTFINHKGDLHVRPVGRPQAEEQPASPGLGLLSVATQPLLYRSSAPILFSALVLYIPVAWIDLFIRDNAQFEKIGQILEQEGNIVTCRLGRRQMSLFSAALGLLQENPGDLLSIQNNLLSLLENFLCNRHRSLLGVNPSSDIDNEADLTLIREAESDNPEHGFNVQLDFGFHVVHVVVPEGGCYLLRTHAFPGVGFRYEDIRSFLTGRYPNTPLVGVLVGIIDQVTDDGDQHMRIRINHLVFSRGVRNTISSL